ncbi:hypothetical protein ACFYUK_15340 [Nonomuraea wenchangensis]
MLSLQLRNRARAGQRPRPPGAREPGAAVDQARLAGVIPDDAEVRDELVAGHGADGVDDGRAYVAVLTRIERGNGAGGGHPQKDATLAAATLPWA